MRTFQSYRHSLLAIVLALVVLFAGGDPAAAAGESAGNGAVRSEPLSRLQNRFQEAANMLAPQPKIAFFAALYNWNATSGGVWTNAANWTPARTTPATDDILQFPTGTYTVTGVPTETIGQLFASGGNSNVTLQPAAGLVTLTIAGGVGNDLVLQPSNSLNISGGTTNTNTLKIFLGAGASAAIGGSMTFSGAQHQIDAADVSGLVFNSGATFTYNPGGTAGNPFTSAGTANAVAFNTGATYVFQGGANPFGLGAPNSKVVFNPGSLFKQTGTGTPSFNGRSYANYELANAASVTVTGGTAMSIDNITVTQGTLNYNMTGITGHTINGTISVASGATMNFAPATAATINVKGSIAIAGTLGFNPTVSETINLNGSSTQTISGAGNFAANASTTITDSNSAGVTLSRNLDNMSGTFTVASGGLLTTGTRIVQGAGTFSIASGGSMTIGDPAGVTAAPTAAGNIQTGTRTFGTGARYTFNAASAQVTGDGINNPASLLNFNNPSGVTLSQNLSTDANGTIALTNGIVTTSSAASLLSNNSAGAVPPIGGTPGPTAFVNGPMAVQFSPSAPGATCPVGKGGNYTPISVSAGTISGLVGVSCEAFAGSTGGTAGSGMQTINSDRYWNVSQLLGVGNASNFLISVTDTNPTTGKVLGWNSTASAAAPYASIGGTPNANSLLSTVPINQFGFFVIGTPAPPPFALDFVSPVDNTSNVPVATSLTVQFNHAANPTTITVSGTTSCTGSVQLSADGFNTCVPLQNPTSGNNITFTITPTAPLTPGMIYKIRVTTAAQDTNAQALPSTFTQNNGWTTVFAPCAQQPSGMTAWYRAENNGLDTRGNGNMNLLNGLGFTSGEVGQAFNFTTAGGYPGSGYASTPASGGNEPAKITVDAWVYMNSLDSTQSGNAPVGHQFILSKGNSRFGTGNFISSYTLAKARSAGVDNFYFCLDFGINNELCAKSSTALTAGQWYHVAGSYDPTDASGTAKIYLNGVLDGTNTNAGAALPANQPIGYAPNPLFLGRSGDPIFDALLNGKLDEVEIFDRALSATEIQGLYNAGTTGKCLPSPTTNGLAGWWAGDGDTRDISANGNNGTAGTALAFTVGKVGQAMSFNGNSNANVTVPDAPSLNPSTEMSVEGWVYPTTDNFIPNAMSVIINKETIGATQYEMARRLSTGTCPTGGGIPAGNFAVFIGGLTGLPDNCGGWVDSNASLPLNTWSHVAMTYDGAALRAYVNGVMTRSVAATGTILSGSGSLRLGSRVSNAEVWVGNEDEIALYSRALTANEVQSIFNAGVAGKYKSATSPVGAVVSTNTGGDATVIFASITGPGLTQQVPLDPTKLPPVLAGHTATGLFYDIATGASFTGQPTVCFHLPYVGTPVTFSRVRIHHLEGGSWVDRTNLGTSDFPNRTICTVGLSSLSPFAIVTTIPTAAGVAVSGRVMNSVGTGLRNARVVMTGEDGTRRTVLTNAFGYYIFDNVQAGNSYLVGIESRSYVFAPRLVPVTDTLTNVDFTPQ